MSHTMSLTRNCSIRNTWANSNGTKVVPPQPPAVPIDTISMNSRIQQSAGNNLKLHSQERNKYNTLTPAEAKKLTKYLNGRQPARTASVLHKPRAPPIIVNDLELYGSQSNNRSTIKARTATLESDKPTTRCGSSCSTHSSYRDRRHSMNLGQQCNSRLQFSKTNIYNNNKLSTQSPNDSESNLSFRSSLDIVDSAYGSDRLQTMSVDLGNPTQHYNGLNYRYTQNSSDVQDSNKLSDESYSSAKSHQSESVKLRTASKVSLSSSTSKVFQNQLSNLKKFLRYIPIKRSFINNETGHNFIGTGLSDKENLGDTISQICLNRSQSPPICPPPPRELKSMSYMESAVNYSNYDEFTRTRNRQASNMLNGYSRGDRDQRPEDNGLALNDTDSWQLTSLPVSYERNLTTVFEEKQNSNDLPKSPSQNLIRNDYFGKNEKHLIKPPANFDDKGYENAALDLNSASTTNSSQSFTSITTADSVLDYHRQTASSFRFSYAQPKACEQVSYSKNAGLPPKMPPYDVSLGINPSNVSSPDATKSTSRDVVDYRESNGFENDLDTTIISDTSTLHEDKCAELDRTVESLKNKLIAKEKELTDLQLKQWSSDYLIDQLKLTISRLEKENSQLKVLVVNRVNL